jgi:hypothetical protein
MYRSALAFSCGVALGLRSTANSSAIALVTQPVEGNRGTVPTAEMYRSDTEKENSRRAIKGVAKDNKDNIYKVAF